MDIVTVFTGEPERPQQGFWDALCGFASSAESVPARRREEQEAFAEGPHRVHFLDLPDKQYIADRPRTHAEAIADAVRNWIRASNGWTVAVPAGAGWRPGPLRELPERLHLGRLVRPPGPRPNPDHLYLRNAALSAVADATILLYEELPYLWGGPADPAVEEVSARFGVSAAPLVVPVDRKEKAARIAHYGSQLPHLGAPRRGRIDDPASLPHVERYWALSRPG